MTNSGFTSAKLVPVVVQDLAPVAEEIMQYFRAQGFEVSGTRTALGGWHISMTKGDWFKTIVGLKSALNLDLSPQGSGTLVTAGIGIFETQAIPTAVTLLLFWPVIFAQIWGLVQQEQLDDEAMAVAENSLVTQARAEAVPPDPEI